MKDEIKEILDKLDYIISRTEDDILVNQYGIEIEDYITNLQTIEKEYSSLLSENAELENKITNLQEEKCKTIHTSIVQKKQLTNKLNKLTNKYNDLQKENDSLKQMSKDTYNTSQEIMAELSQENERLNNIISETSKDIQHELSHLKANDEISWNEEFYTNNKLDYRKLCIALLEQVVNELKEKENE